MTDARPALAGPTPEPASGAQAGLERGGPAGLPGELEAQYAAYRRRQARGLIHLLPREAVRPLYRRALEQGCAAEAGDDPLGALLSYCERLLPLPPFETWREDVRRHATAHLQDLDDSAEAPTAEAPTTVVTRRFAVDREPWVAHLRSYREGETWRAYIAFENERTHRLHRTALIFCESDPVDVRERFLEFDLASLQAFLRSALP